VLIDRQWATVKRLIMYELDRSEEVLDNCKPRTKYSQPLSVIEKNALCPS